MLRAPERPRPVARDWARRPTGAWTVAPGARRPATPLALDGVSKRWSAAQAPVLNDISLTLASGSSTWIGGRNGVGKTTLLRIAAGLIHPELGRVHARGRTVHEDRARYQRLVSLLPAGDRGLYARLSVRRHLEFWARIAMVRRERLQGLVRETIAAFELAELAERRVDRLSMGQRQRLRIAMTFLAQPEVVLLDEPLTSLDEEGVELLRQAAAAVIDRGGALLWCSPNVDHDQGSFDARWTLECGRLVPA